MFCFTNLVTDKNEKTEKVILHYLQPHQIQVNSCYSLSLILVILLKHDKKVYSKAKEQCSIIKMYEYVRGCLLFYVFNLTKNIWSTLISREVS